MPSRFGGACPWMSGLQRPPTRGAKYKLIVKLQFALCLVAKHTEIEQRFDGATPGTVRDRRRGHTTRSASAARSQFPAARDHRYCRRPDGLSRLLSAPRALTRSCITPEFISSSYTEHQPLGVEKTVEAPHGLREFVKELPPRTAGILRRCSLVFNHQDLAGRQRSCLCVCYNLPILVQSNRGVPLRPRT
jgi:hypothetical protein